MDTPPSGIPSEDPLAPNEIEWLLDGLANPSTDIQTASARALVTLPLAPESWLAVSDGIEPLLAPATATPELLDAATRVPTRRVRSQLHTLIDTMTDRTVRLPLLSSLAVAGDPAVVPSLLATMRTNDDPATIEMLSRFAVPEARATLVAMASTGTAETRLWAAIALAQLDEPDALERLLAEPGIDEGLPMLWGDPMLVHERMQGRGPWPGRTQAMLDRLAADAEANPRPTDVIIEALRSSEPGPSKDPGPTPDPTTPDSARQAQARALRRHLERSFPDPAIFSHLPVEPGESSTRYGLLANLPGRETAQLVDTLWGRLAAEYLSVQEPSPAADPWNLTIGGNELVTMTRDIGPAFMPNIPELGRTFEVVQDHHQLADQLGWTVGRAGMRHVVVDLGRFAGGAGGTKNLAGIHLVELAGNRANDPAPPIYGGSAPSPQPRPVTIFLDDMMTGSAPPQDTEAEPSGGSDAPVTDPPRTAYGLLDCPQEVQTGKEFELNVGLASKLAPGSQGTPFIRPEWSQGPYVLTVRLHVGGFTLRDGEALRHILPVTVEEPYPVVTLHLTPDALDAGDVEPVEREITATYYIGSQPISFTSRTVQVVRQASLAKPLSTSPAKPVVIGGTIPATFIEPDLTVEIRRGARVGDLEWTFETPDAAAWSPPPDALTSSIGSAPEEFAYQLIQSINLAAGKPGLPLRIRSLGIDVNRAIPGGFWPILEKVAAAMPGQPPSVLLLTEDPYVPWELAVFEPPWQPGTESFLGAEVVVGRWVLPRNNRDDDMPREEARAVSAMQVMSGVYPRDKGQWRELPHAEQEANDLVSKFSGVKVVAEAAPVARFLMHPPDAQAFHFSGHGIYDPKSRQNGLVLSDLTYMDAELVGGGHFHPNPHPFVFLNACQAGSAYTTLGMFSGLAGAFMKAGAAAVVAPLWSVKDDEARDLSLQFYNLAVEQDVPPAEILRRWRASFAKNQPDGDETPPSPIHLAYQYFGHPALRLVRHRP